ncbi:hypothetical protein [Streptococcus agalactiae]|nr:hypothetical protein [Streptococcus agalactiae]
MVRIRSPTKENQIARVSAIGKEKTPIAFLLKRKGEIFNEARND